MRRLCGISAVTLLLFAGSLGCGSSTDAPPPAAEPELQDGMTAAAVMEKMVATYGDAEVYMDNAEYAEHFVLADDGIERQGPPLVVSVLLKRPNLFRITRVENPPAGAPEATVVACDGDKLEASISRWEPQRLSLIAPDTSSLDNIAPDPLLKQALFPVPLQDMFPQLALLLADDEHPAWPLAARDSLEFLPAAEVDAGGSEPVPCYRVQMQTTMGPQICWIDKESFLLRRLELPSEELRKKIYPEHNFESFAWRFDFHDATLEATLPSPLFRLDATSGSGEPVLVEAFAEIADVDDDEAASADE